MSSVAPKGVEPLNLTALGFESSVFTISPEGLALPPLDSN